MRGVSVGPQGGGHTNPVLLVPMSPDRGSAQGHVSRARSRERRLRHFPEVWKPVSPVLGELREHPFGAKLTLCLTFRRPPRLHRDPDCVCQRWGHCQPSSLLRPTRDARNPASARLAGAGPKVGFKASSPGGGG